MNKIYACGRTYTMPTREDIVTLTVGDIAPSSMGDSEVVSIFAIGEDIHGKRYICYYVKLGSNGSLSHSLREGEIDFPVSCDLTYAQRCAIRSQFEPGPLRDHYGKLVGGAGQRI